MQTLSLRLIFEIRNIKTGKVRSKGMKDFWL